MAVVLTVVILFFSGCSNKTVATKTDGLNLNADIIFDSYEYSALFSNSGGIAKMKICSPELLDGLTYTWDNQKLTVSFMGLEYEPSESDKSYGFAKAVYKILSSCGNKSAVYNGDGYELDGMYKDCKWIAVFNKSGIPQSIECERLKIKVWFYE